MTELKKCLCGEPVQVIAEAADMYFILCPHPKCKFFSGYHTSAERVAEIWNTRPEEDRLRKALERINSIADRYWKDELTGDEAAIKLVKTMSEINKALRGEDALTRKFTEAKDIPKATAENFKAGIKATWGEDGKE